MAVLPKTLFRGAAVAAPTTVYTTPSATTTIVTQVTVSNTSGGSLTFTLSFDGFAAFTTKSVAANTTSTFNMKQVLVATDVITAEASTTDINFHISGVEIA
jgi:hypothetical protein